MHKKTRLRNATVFLYLFFESVQMCSAIQGLLLVLNRELLDSGSTHQLGSFAVLTDDQSGSLLDGILPLSMQLTLQLVLPRALPKEAIALHVMKFLSHRM